MSRREGNGSWSSGITVVKPDDLKVVVDLDVVRILRAIEEKAPSGCEFSVLFKGRMKNKTFYVSGSEYVIPKQTVSGASVDFEENLDPYISDGFNVVVHKHPSGLKSFSSSDEKTINSNFDCSLLWVDGEIALACLRLKINADLYLKLEVDVEIDMGKVEVSGVENIKEKKSDIPIGYRYGDYYDDYYRNYIGKAKKL